MSNYEPDYVGKKVLITGGLGFIGSNLAQKLVRLGAEVTILDANLPRYGGNYFNISGIRDKVEVVVGDIRDHSTLKRHIPDKDVVFDLAAQVDYGLSNKEPHLDVDINCTGHLNVLEASKELNPKVRLVFPGSRMMYGSVLESDLPVKEEHALNPQSVYAINKVAGESYFKLYHRLHGLDTVMFRISNPFGPRAQVKHSAYCIANWFVRQALEGKDITVYGDGIQKRDYIFIDDLVDAFLTAGTHPKATGEVYNVGSGTPMRLVDMAHKVVSLTGSGRIVHTPWTEKSKANETGDSYADITKIRSELWWKPKTPFEEGLQKTVDFYRENLKKYI